MGILGRLEKYVLLTTILVFPLLVLTLFSNFFDLPKLTFLVLGVSIALLIKAARAVSESSFSVSLSRFDLGVLAVGLAYLASAMFVTPNKMEAFLFPGFTTAVVASVILFFLVNSAFSKEKSPVVKTLFFSGVLASLVSLLAVSGIMAKVPQLPDFAKDAAFSLLGGKLPEVVLLGALLPLGASLLLSEKEAVRKLFFAVSLVVLGLGFAVSLWGVLPGKPSSPSVVDWNTSWNVAVDTLKESPFLGAGAGNYISAFGRFKPLSYNATDFWAVKFASSSSHALTLLTETGILGIAAFSFLILLIFRELKKTFPKSFPEFASSWEYGAKASLAIVSLCLILLPANLVIWVVFVVLLAASAETKDFTLNLSAHAASAESSFSSKFPAFFIAVPIVAAVVVLGYFSQTALMAEVAFKKSLDAFAQNDGRSTYELMQQAVGLNPYVDRYHSAYAQVNMALARAIAQNENLTDQERETIAQLVQQAIREGKATVTLNPQRAGNWELLAAIYQSIMPFAEGADAFAVQSFSQAVLLDPVNPNLRISLGGIYYALGRYDEAIRMFELAVLAKADLANAHYNLSAGYREKGDIQRAIEAMTNVLALVEADSPDWELAKSELEALEKRRPTQETEGTDNLTPPREAEEPAITPPLELPEDATPPATQ